MGTSTSSSALSIYSNQTALTIRGSTGYDRGFLAFSWDITPDVGTIIGCSLGFNTNATVGTNAGTRALTITCGGNVGIGTSVAPAVNGLGLAIYASDYPRITLRNSTSGDTTGDGLQIAMVGANVQYDLAESGYQMWTTGGTERMRIISGGNIGIGTSTPCQTLEVNGSILASSTGKIGFRYSNTDGNYYSYLRSATTGSIGPIVLGGGFESNGGGNEAIRFVTNAAPGERTSLSIYNAGIACFGFTVCAPCFATISDYRMKSNLRPIEGLSIIMNTKPYKFEYNYDCSTSFGMIAHELQDTVPEAVFGYKDGEVMQGVDYMKLLPITIKAIQEQQCTICTQASRITLLESCLGIA